MSSDTEPSARFEPLRPASGWRLTAAFILGPLTWLVALAVGAVLIADRWAIEVALVIAVASFVLSLIVLTALRAGRRRHERRYVDRG